MGNQRIFFEHLKVEALGFDLESVSDWLMSVAASENVQIASLLYVFCTDEYLHKLNETYLNHDTYTDIITFPETYDPVCAEIYISLNRVSDNAKQHSDGQIDRELSRVMLHGLLHMCGYDDKTKREKIAMREKEDFYLAKFQL